MAEYDIMPTYEDSEIFRKNDNVNDLQAYYMTQFNLEVEQGNKKIKADPFKYGVEESFDLEVLNNWTNNNNINDFDVIDKVIDSNISEENMKEVLLDLDNIEFEEKEIDDTSYNATTLPNSYQNDYIDDESLIDELCREDGESNRLTPETYNEEFFSQCNEKQILPSIETAFSKRYIYNNIEELSETFNVTEKSQNSNNCLMIENLDHYSYPNNILQNLEKENKYVLPDTPTSCTEFIFENNRRTVSVSESIESDVNSTSYYDENSETLDEDDLFINLDDFGLAFENENGDYIQNKNYQDEWKNERQKYQGEKACLWEKCFEKHPNQSSLVEHIERAHVNSYKGDEFSCLWHNCARARRPFNARYKLLIHMRVHSGHKPNRCHHPGCGKAFSRLENLKIHIRSHTGERPYTCPAPHCRKAFSNSSDRAKHQRTHFNARPYACGAIGCGKRYTDPSSLRKHVKSHPHIPNTPRTCIAPSRPIRRPEDEQTVPSSPAKLATLRCIRDKLTVPKLHRF